MVSVVEAAAAETSVLKGTRMTNRDRLVEILNHVTYRFAPERGVTAEYIAMVLDVNGVTAPEATDRPVIG